MFKEEQHHELLERIIEVLPQSIVVYASDGRLVYCNETAAFIGGAASARELLEQHPGGFAVQQEAYDEEGNRIPKEEYASARAARGIRTTHALVRQALQGKQYWHSISSAPLYNAQGEVEYVVTFGDDVTEQKIRADRVRFLLSAIKVLSLESGFKERLREKANLIVPLFADWCTINVVQPDGSLERVAVVHRDPSKADLVEALARRAPQDGGRDAVLDVLKTGVSQIYPVVSVPFLSEHAHSSEWITLASELKIHSTLIIPIMSKKKVLGVLSLAYAESGREYTQDDLEFFEEYAQHLSVLLENAQLFRAIEQRDKAKDTFLATLSHELRNPLAPIKSSLELLGLHSLPPETGECVAVIETQFDHMTKLLNDLLNVTRYTQGNILLDPSPVDLVELVAQTVRTVERYIGKREITLTVELPTKSVMCLADETRLHQALTNLLHNAEKFTPQGGHITVSLTHDDKTASISVADDGVGIASEDLATIFDLHVSARRLDPHRNSGLGIGLTLVREIMLLHGGSASVESAGVGKGARFTLTLPLDPHILKIQPAVPKPEISKIDAKKILIVDDNDAAAKGISMLLEYSGHHTLLAHDGHSALQLANEFKPALVFLDIGLPDVDGYEVARRLRAQGARQTLVAVTGYGQEEDKARALGAGFDHHLTKPVRFADLEAIIRTTP